MESGLKSVNGFGSTKAKDKFDLKPVERKMEKLRKANEQLRESGIFWHDACKDAIRDLLGKKQTR